MLTLNDGRNELWQWDTGRTLAVDADCSQVHFSNKVFGRSIDMDVVDGMATIPDILLQTDKDLTAWAFVGTAENGYTKISKSFKVNRRNKPADYVFTPTEQTTLDEIIQRIDRIEESQDPDAIKNAVDEYLANNPIQAEEKDPTVPDWAKQPTKPKYTADEVGAVATVNGTAPDENGNVEIEIPEASEPDMTGYATERYVQENYQPKGNYLTEVPEGYAKTEDIPAKPEDIGAQPAGNYLTEVPIGYATEEFVKNKIAEAELSGEEVDLSGYAQKSELPTKVSELKNDVGYLTEHQDLSDYAKKTELPVVPVQSVNGKTGTVKLSASDVGARPNTWMPTAQDVGALPSTYTPPNQTSEQVGADPKGTAANAVSRHNTSDDAHNDIRLELKAISDRLTAFFDSDNQTLDELSEIVAYITSNKTLIDSITTSKVSVADIINNLTTNVINKPLSAAQGVVLKGLIDAVSKSLSNYQPKGDYALRSELPTVPTKVSAFTNDAGYLTEHQDISGLAKKTETVSVNAQNLNEVQKAQARKNIGAEAVGKNTVVAQPEPPENTNVLWFDTDDNSEDEPESGGSAPADWNAAEGEPGHVLNRTHYDYIAKVVEEITINASSQDTTFTAASPIVIGETYSIHWGDKIYVCEAVDGAVMGPEGAGFPLLGNYGNLIGGTNTGEPFVITVMGTNGMVIGFGEDIEITFSIDGKTTKKISEKYLPAFVKSCIVPVNSLEDNITKITLDTTELAEAIKNNYPIYIEKVSGYIAARYTVNRVALDILADAGITTLTQAIDWHIAMGYSVSNLPVRLYFSDGWGDNRYSVYININE